MKRNDSKKGKVFHSMIEIEKEYLPRLHRKRLEATKFKDPATFGTELAREFLKGVKHQLTK